MRYVMVDEDHTHVFVYTFQEMLFSLAHQSSLKIFGYSDHEIELELLCREAQEKKGMP